MLRVTTVWGGVGQGLPYYSTHYFGGETSGEAAAAAAAVAEYWNDNSQIITTGLVPVVQPEVEVVQPTNGQTIGVHVVTPPESDVAATGDVLPWTTQGLVRWRTGVFVGGREIRGRTFLPGMMEANNLVGVPAPTWNTIANQAAASLITASVPAGDLVVYSRTHFQAAVVTSGSSWNQWATVRSRRD